MEPWIGNNWNQKLLILAESWYGGNCELDLYFENWAMGNQPDVLFSCIFNACNDDGLRRESATFDQKMAFWHQVAFDNLVNWSYAQTLDRSPTGEEFSKGAATLDNRLRQLNPARVWVIGKTTWIYAEPVLSKLKISCVWSNHPRSGLSSEKLRHAWLEAKALADFAGIS